MSEDPVKKYLGQEGTQVLVNQIKLKVNKIVSVDNDLVRFNGVSGELQGSNIAVNDDGDILPKVAGSASSPDLGSGSYPFGDIFNYGSIFNRNGIYIKVNIGSNDNQAYTKFGLGQIINVTAGASNTFNTATITLPAADGTLALAENVVPYSGASSHVDLNNKNLSNVYNIGTTLMSIKNYNSTNSGSIHFSTSSNAGNSIDIWANGSLFIFSENDNIGDSLESFMIDVNEGAFYSSKTSSANNTTFKYQLPTITRNETLATQQWSDAKFVPYNSSNGDVNIGINSLFAGSVGFGYNQGTADAYVSYDGESAELDIGTNTGSVYIKTYDSSGGIFLQAASGGDVIISTEDASENLQEAHLSSAHLTSSRTFYFPDQDGELALKSDVSSVYKLQGNDTVEHLNTITKSANMNGYVYNILTSVVQDPTYTLNNYSGTITVQPGDNVVLVYVSATNWYWDKLAATVDLSPYLTIASAQNTYLPATTAETTYVPYTGATSHIDLNNKNISNAYNVDTTLINIKNYSSTNSGTIRFNTSSSAGNSIEAWANGSLFILSENDSTNESLESFMIDLHDGAFYFSGTSTSNNTPHKYQLPTITQNETLATQQWVGAQNYVPFSGADSSVDLGSYSLTASTISIHYHGQNNSVVDCGGFSGGSTGNFFIESAQNIIIDSLGAYIGSVANANLIATQGWVNSNFPTEEIDGNDVIAMFNAA